MAEMQGQVMPCPRCGQSHWTGDAVCPRCGLPQVWQRLGLWIAEAQRLESIDPQAALAAWQQCLVLLPPGSPQALAIQHRMGQLSGVPAVSPFATASPAQPYAAARPAEPSWGSAASSYATNPYAYGRPMEPTWASAILRTVGSMVLSIVLYSVMFGAAFATGFVVLMLVHELGHLLAMRRYGLKSGAPVFIPFMGAVINMKQQPPNAMVEAVVGIAGPVAGTVGAAVCYAGFLWLGWPVLGPLAFYGVFLNLFNLLPIPPMDGGRVMAAVSPWTWLVGLAAMGGLVAFDFVHRGSFNPILALVIVFALPRIWQTLRHGAIRQGAYYQISRRSSWTIAGVYLLLAVVLVTGFLLTRPLALMAS